MDHGNGYHSGALPPLSLSERNLLPENLQYLDLFHYSSDSFEQRRCQLDAIAEQRQWLKDNIPSEQTQ